MGSTLQMSWLDVQMHEELFHHNPVVNEVLASFTAMLTKDINQNWIEQTDIHKEK